MDAKVRGLRADIYKSGGKSFSNGGISEEHEEVTIVGVAYDGRESQKVHELPREAQASEPSEEAPPVVFVKRAIGNYYVAAAVGEDGTVTRLRKDDCVGPMMGGCFVGGTDARIVELTGYYGPVALHDRFETTTQYVSYD